ncbi:MAG: hypothetical protein N2C14_23970 [Planctomycetales bacterium]
MKRFLAVSMLAALVVGPIDRVRSEDSPSNAKQGGSLDDELFKELTDGLGLDDVVPAADETAGKSEPQPAKDELDRSLLEELKTDAEPDGDSHPFSQIARQMQRVESLISEGDAGDETQGVQREILGQLTELLKQAQKQCAQCQKPGQPQDSQQSRRSSVPKPGQPKGGQPKPQQDSQQDNQPKQGEEATDRVEQADPEAAELDHEVTDLVRAVWGHLPEREREVLVQLFNEKYLPQYQQLIKQYYSRLARERNSRP